MSLLPPVAGVIGWPVAHSKSPLIHRFWLAKLGIDGDYSRFPVAPDRLAAFLRALPAMGLRGVNVTVPHKLAVMAHLDAIEDPSVGAVNCVVVMADGRLVGHNSDVAGVAGPAAAMGLVGRRGVVIGSGGAARAAVAAMRRLGLDEVEVMARDRAKAAAMLEGLGVAGRVLPIGERLEGEVALLFNATSLGMAGQGELDVDLAGLADGCVVFDAVYAPLETGLLRSARARGLRTIDGLAMLVGQAAEAFELFYGVAAPRGHDDELRALLTR